MTSRYKIISSDDVLISNEEKENNALCKASEFAKKNARIVYIYKLVKIIEPTIETMVKDV